MEIDSVDFKILELLEEQGYHLTDISNMVGLTRFTVHKRVQKLYQNGVIKGPKVILNPFATGKRHAFFFEFKTNPNEPWIADFLSRSSNCDVLYGTTGEYSLFARFKFRSKEAFNQYLQKIDHLMSNSIFKKYHFINLIECFKEKRVIFDTSDKIETTIDEVDDKILYIIQNENMYITRPQPLTTIEISKLLEKFDMPLSQPSVSRRLIKLRQRKVILRETSDIDYEKLGFQTRFILKLKVNPRAYNSLARDKFVHMKEITDLYRTNEDYGFLAIVQVRNVKEYNEFITTIYDLPSVIDTFSTIILEERPVNK